VSPKTKTLVICVDRDNDIGEKAGLETPIVGRDAVLSAATKFALADSEESDINAVFEAVRIYDWLSSSKEDVEPEVVLIAGDKRVGVESDMRIGQKLDDVLSKFRARSAILVSDGAEDEWIIPIIQSRVKINSVRRVVVKQIDPLENTFYVIKRLLEDPSFSHTFLPPIGIILFLLAVSLLLKLSGEALGLILGVIGIYTLLKGLGRENLIMEFAESVRQSLYSGKLSFVMYICAIVLILAGTYQGYFLGYTQVVPELDEQIWLGAMHYIKFSIWWYIGAALAPLIGKMMSMLIEGEKIVKHWAILFSIIASGLVLWGGSESIIWLSKGSYSIGYVVLFLSILGAGILSVIGVKISWYMKSTLKIKEKEGKAGREPEERRVQD
jgi:putative membrane protein